ncbi:MAG: hypothetical protein ABW201_16590 [Candidatus Thiodiazotropha sp.]
MNTTLNRTGFDKLGSVALLVALLMFSYYVYSDMDSLEKAILYIAVFIFLTNAFFINLTPIAKLQGKILTLYQESQPTVFNLKPQTFNITEINEIEISRKLLEFRAVFKLRHGRTIYHSFPATREKRIKMFFDFLSDNTNSEIIKTAYNKRSHFAHYTRWMAFSLRSKSTAV